MITTTRKLALPLIALLLAACGKPAAPAADARPRVLVSNPPTAWLVKQIAGDKVVVQTLAAGGGCGHGFQPTDAELADAGKAKIWFRAGLEFEQTDWAKAITKANMALYNLSVNVCRPDAFKPQGADETFSHYWVSFPGLDDTARNIETTYQTLLVHRGESVTIPSSELKDLRASLASRHAKLQSILAPLKGQAFLADHPAYGYFAADYGLKQLAIEEEGHETSDAHLTDLIAEAKKAQVKVLFLAEEANRPMAETVAKAVGATIVAADPNEENTPELLERMANELVKAHEVKP